MKNLNELYEEIISLDFGELEEYFKDYTADEIAMVREELVDVGLLSDTGTFNSRLKHIIEKKDNPDGEDLHKLSRKLAETVSFIIPDDDDLFTYREHFLQQQTEAIEKFSSISNYSVELIENYMYERRFQSEGKYKVLAPLIRFTYNGVDYSFKYNMNTNQLIYTKGDNTIRYLSNTELKGYYLRESYYLKQSLQKYIKYILE